MLPNHVHVGKYSSIAKDVVFHQPDDQHLYTSNHNVVFTDNWKQPGGNDTIEIGNDVWVGQGAKIFSGIKIGDGSIIGAWAVVPKDIPPFSVVIGNPPKIKARFTPEQIEKLQKIKWWEWDQDMVASRRSDMLDINVFLSKYE